MNIASRENSAARQRASWQNLSPLGILLLFITGVELSLLKESQNHRQVLVPSRLPH